MQKDYIYPEIGDRTSPKEWAEAGKPNLIVNARAKVDDVLANHFPNHISTELDDQIRESFNVLLPKEAMSPKQET